MRARGARLRHRPVEAAAATARRLRGAKPGAVLHVGVAGGRRLIPGSLVLGTEAVYVDIAAEITVVDRVEADRELLVALQELFPDAVSLPIATTAAVSGQDPAHELRVEGMEGFGVLRACALGGVPAVEVGRSRTTSERATASAGGSTAASRF